MKRLFYLSLLIIDDSSLVRLAVKEGIKNFNIEILEAANGASGLTLMQKKPPDIVLLDLNLPDGSGFDILKKIRQDPATSKIPVIITTISNSAADVERSLKEGAQFYLLKPIEPGLLIRRIAKILDIQEEEISRLSFERPETISSVMVAENDAPTNKTVSYEKTESSSLKPGMVLGLPVINPESGVLYKAGLTLDQESIGKIISNDIRFVFIKPSA